MTNSLGALPEVVYSADQVGELDRRFIEDTGIDGFALMQRPAAAAYDSLMKSWPSPGRLCVVCGPGNNGGDGFLVARLALEGGWRVQLLCLVAREKIAGDAGRALAAFEQAGGVAEAFDDAPIDADVVVDSLLGTGLSRDVEGSFAAAIARMNQAHAAGAGMLAVDIASGIGATTGKRWAHAVQADITATFIGLKLGLFTGAGAGCCGDVAFDDLGAPRDLYDGFEPLARRVTQAALKQALPQRARDAHKGDNGHVLCMGGNRGMGGSIRMSAEAALRAGAGLVSVACHRDHAGAMSQARPELMCLGVDGAQHARPLLDKAAVIAIGPGLGQDDWAHGLYDLALDSDRTLVVDADALNLLAAAPRARGNWILTPHPGEAARLLGIDTAQVAADRAACACELAQRYDAVAVLKGAGTLIATPSGLWLCTAGNAGMAVGGMGDLLTGVIAGLCAQGLDIEAAAALGVLVHAQAGDAVADAQGQRGMLPSDLLSAIVDQVNW